jgi:hypothetical protein
VRRFTYLTARCPQGCECWLHPGAVDAHVEFGRCRGRPWVDDADETVIVTGDIVYLLVAALPADVFVYPGADDVPIYNLLGEPAVRLASPLHGVAPRPWLHTALAAVDRDGRGALDDAMDSVRFAHLEAQFGDRGRFVLCPHCGQTLERRGLAGHQGSSSRCRWIRAAREVRLAWQEGWRDPYSMGGGTPVTWGDLQRAAWRDRIWTVRFPRWTAVLLSPYPGVGQRSTVRSLTEP